MPPGIPYIVGNEAAERFSFYGMKGILVVFMTKYLFLMDQDPSTAMSETDALKWFHLFSAFVYLTPIFGALLADMALGKYRTIIYLSLGYCLGHALLAMMGSFWMAGYLLALGLFCITIGAGGIKSCVSAHVGDQFGKTNAHLLTKVFNYFYWSINFGALLSHLLTPWLLEWYGPHWAFGVPGVLMGVATLVFWMGRWKFIHIPAKGSTFWKETVSREGLYAVLKLCVIYLFVAIFWTLFDQTASAWVLQADDMNLNFLGITWLPAQIQFVNPLLILILIPAFTFYIYPAINKFFPLTPLRKMAIGFFVMTIGFGITALIQESIDAGNSPSVGWQFLAWLIVTPAEIMISIVCLEFSYTQAPRAMKSFVMGVFWLSVFLGNLVTVAVNQVIQIPNTLQVIEKEYVPEAQQNTVTFPGLDEEEGTKDDVVLTYEGEERTGMEFAGQEGLDEAASRVITAIEANDYLAPREEEGQALLDGLTDAWGNPLRYTLVTSRKCRVSSDGPDGKERTRWDSGVQIDVSVPEVKQDSAFRFLEPERPWLERRKDELGLLKGSLDAEGDPVPTISQNYYLGGLTRLEGAGYFWFFTILVGITGGLFLIVVRFYKTKEYLHEEESVLDAEAAGEAPHS